MGLGVAVGDADASDRFPAQLVGSLPVLPLGVEVAQAGTGSINLWRLLSPSAPSLVLRDGLTQQHPD